MKFEQALDKLQEIADKMESNQISLDESLALYQEGIKLCSFCKSELDKAQGKITQLSDDSQVEIEVDK